MKEGYLFSSKYFIAAIFLLFFAHVSSQTFTDSNLPILIITTDIDAEPVKIQPSTVFHFLYINHLYYLHSLSW